MNRLRQRGWIVALFAAAGCAAAKSTAPESTAQELTVEWIFGGGSGAVAQIPTVQWCDDGSALLYDTRSPEDRRTLERLDPQTLERTAAVDAASLLKQIRVELGDGAPSTFPMPVEIDRTGKRGFYLWNGDLYVVELKESRLRRVTNTAEAEKSARLSPNGSWLAFVRSNDLYVLDLESGAESRVTTDGSAQVLNGTLSWVYWEELFGRLDIGYWWSPDSRRIAFLQTDESEVDRMVFPAFRPEVPQLNEQRYPKAGRPNPKVRVGLAEIEGSTMHWLDLSATPHEYVARVKWLPDSRQVAVQTLTRDQHSLTLLLADFEDGSLRPVLTETSQAWVNVHDDLYFLEDGKRFVWMSERNGFAHLYLYRMDGRLERQLTKGLWATRSSGGGVFWMRQAVTGIDEKAGWVYFSALEKSSIENHLYRVRLDGTGFERLTDASGRHGITMRRDAKFYFDAFSNSAQPPELSLCKVGGDRSVLAPAQVELAASLDLVYPEFFSVPARDSFSMPAQIWRPRDFRADRRYPLILHVYAGPSAPEVQNVWSGNKGYFNNLLVRDGFLVVQVDNRAATAISKTLEDTLYGNSLGDPELNDLVDAVQWLKQQTWVDPERVGVWGWSNGGSITLLCMTRSQEFKAGISVAPVTDWSYYDSKWAESLMGLPEQNPTGYQNARAWARAADLHGRLLLVHGTYDDNVHPQNSWHLIDELIKANKNFDMLWFPMRGHAIADPPAKIHLYKKMREFWNANL